MKFLVIADDLSGATEIGGIGFQCGLKSVVQFSFQPGSDADLVVVDLNTRSMNGPDAEATVSRIARQLRESGQIVPIFKKVDSVFRGHLVAEIGALTRELGVERVLLFPANPAKGRKIIDGQYLIDGTPLHKTVFGSDPDHPVTTPVISELLAPGVPGFAHLHLGRNGVLPEEGLVTGDTGDPGDLQRIMAMANPVEDLCCGGAGFFQEWLGAFGYHGSDALKGADSGRPSLPNVSVPGVSPSGRLGASTTGGRDVFDDPGMLIVNGSTVQNEQERTSITEFGIPHLPLPGEWEGDRFHLNEESERIWQHDVTEALATAGRAIVTIDHPLKPIDHQSQLFSKVFLTLIHVLESRGVLKTLHLGITGGATASDILRGFNVTELTILGQEGPGVVAVSGSRGSPAKITIKPGSYPWPDTFLNRLRKKK